MQTNAYCTLFDKNYLDKGLVMMESLMHTDSLSMIYVLCMDDKVYECLQKYNNNRVIPVSFDEFMDEELLNLKKTRSNAEFCWTCTARIIRYVLEKYNEPVCTYVDADLYFYSNPQVLLDEMKEKNCTVQVVPHQFPDTKEGRLQEELYGKNCVQFNTFSNEENSLKLLKEWEASCIEECSNATVGDQMFTSDWGKYSFVNVSSNRGAGIASWNIYRYKHVGNKKDVVYDRYEHSEYKLVFYHFAQIDYQDKNKVYIICPKLHWNADPKLIKSLYLDYLRKTDDMKYKVEDMCGFFPLLITKKEKQTSVTSKTKKKEKITIKRICRALNFRLLAYARKNVCNLEIYD